MQVHLIISTDGSDLEDIITKAFDSDHRYHISRQIWLVASKRGATNPDVYKILYTAAEGQTPDEPITGTMIVPVRTYYGYGNVATWQWITKKQSL